MGWLKDLFSSQDQQNGQEDINDLRGLDDEPSFLFSQHMRILLAILVAFLSAVCMWWIVA